MAHLRVLSLNCQKAYRRDDLEVFLTNVLNREAYDFILLQEASNPVAEICDNSASYSFLQPFNAAANVQSQLGILYRKSFQLQSSSLCAFAHIRTRNAHRPEFGLLLGKFKVAGTDMLVGSLHLNPGIQFLSRRRELSLTKEFLVKENPTGLPVVFGGDFNSGSKWENSLNRRALSPDFVNCTSDSGSTHDCSYLEPVVFLNRIGLWLAKAGIVFRFKTDHIYTDRKTAEMSEISCAVLPDRVSDHSPLEVTFTFANSVSS